MRDHELGSSNGCFNDPLLIDLRCGIPGLVDLLTNDITRLGMRLDPKAQVQLVIDLPFGFAIPEIERRDSERRVIVLTENRCPEYVADLCELGSAAVVVGIQFDAALARRCAEMLLGDMHHAMPPFGSRLTRAERTILRDVASGWSNRRIAQAMGCEEKTVRNALTRVYAKLGVRNRVEAALYYWGQHDTLH